VVWHKPWSLSVIIKTCPTNKSDKKSTKMTINELLDTYYKGFAQKANWEGVIADNFQFIGGDMTKPEPIVGKEAYIQVIKRFSQLFQSMKVKEMIIQGDKACVIGNYDYLFPNGQKINGNVAEVWTVKNEKLQSLTIYFDTLTFANNSK
jgi:ketosteroid isomerase-like protein